MGQLLKAAEAAEFLRLSVNHLYVKVRAGEIPHIRIGTTLRFDREQLRAWLEENRHGPKVAVG
jgi:excisionase family DNA binding protein